MRGALAIPVLLLAGLAPAQPQDSIPKLLRSGELEAALAEARERLGSRGAGQAWLPAFGALVEEFRSAGRGELLFTLVALAPSPPEAARAEGLLARDLKLLASSAAALERARAGGGDAELDRALGYVHALRFEDREAARAFARAGEREAARHHADLDEARRAAALRQGAVLAGLLLLAIAGLAFRLRGSARS
jgi:hypothetical protein